MAGEKKQEAGLLDDLVEDQAVKDGDEGLEDDQEQKAASDKKIDEAGSGENKEDSKDESLDDLIASLNETAGQFLGPEGQPAQQVQEEPKPQQKELPRYEAPLQMNPVTFERPVVQISQNDFDDATASPAGLQRYTEKVIGAVIQALQKPVNDGLSGVANFALQNALTKSVETLTPVVDHRIQTQATIDRWWRRNSDLENAANLVGVAANRILAKNPKVQLSQLLDEAGKEVRATIAKLRGQKQPAQGAQGKKPGFINASAKGGQPSQRKKDSIASQLGIM